MAVVNAPPPPPANEAVQVAPVEGEKAPKIVKTAYVIPEGGLKEWPSDWRNGTHKPLSYKDFAKGKEYLYFEHQAAEFQRKADASKRKAETLKKFGSGTQAKAASDFLKLSEKMAGIKAKLVAEMGEAEAEKLFAAMMKMGEQKKDEAPTA